MDWKSPLAGFKEVPGTVDPIVFRYPARSSAAAPLVGGAVEIVAGLFISAPICGAFR